MRLVVVVEGRDNVVVGNLVNFEEVVMVVTVVELHKLDNADWTSVRSCEEQEVSTHAVAKGMKFSLRQTPDTEY